MYSKYMGHGQLRLLLCVYTRKLEEYKECTIGMFRFRGTRARITAQQNKNKKQQTSNPLNDCHDVAPLPSAAHQLPP
jgi:hypothetical protein